MAIFKKSEPPAQKPRERPAPMSRNQADAAISIIGTGMNVVGDLSTEGIVRVEGHVRGTIRAGTAVVLGQAGTIEGNIFTQDAVIGGRVSGSVVASNRLELQSTCTVEGEIRTRAEHLKLEEGARFAGQVHMIEDEPPAQVLAPQLGTGIEFDGSDAYASHDHYAAEVPSDEGASALMRPDEEQGESADDADGHGGKDRKKAEAR